jgi:AcrR family transcriptional regulator
MQLYIEHGFDQTTVADIAERAGVTGRTFFRYFADKREVLFAGAAELERRVIDALETAPRAVAPLDAVAIAIGAAGDMIGAHREFSRQRQAVIEATPELQERELIKLAALSVALADGLRRRGLSTTEAKLVAETGVAVFRAAFEQWLTASRDRGLARVIRESFARLRALAASSSGSVS